MLNNLSRRFAKLLVENTDNAKSMEEIYVYGIELILSTGLGFLSILILSMIFDELISGVVFICFFAPLRMFVGGYHAETYGKCFIISNISYLCILMLKKIIWKRISPYILMVVLFIAVIYIFLKTPVINENQDISIEKQLRSKKISRILLVAEISLISSLHKSQGGLMCMAILSVSLVAFFMLISKKPIIVEE